MKKIAQSKYPRRLWAVFGFPESGKTTFITQMQGPLFVIDSDFRFDEKLHLLNGKDAYWNESPQENNDPLAIVRALGRDLPGAKIGTIAVDSLTSIIQPFVTEAMLANKAGENKSKAAAFQNKAIAMRALQDGVTRYGTDVAWIWHLQHGRNNSADEVVSPTVPREEIARLKRSINMLIHLGKDQQGRYATVEWVHEKGKVNIKLYDEAGMWAGMPERIEEAVYSVSKACEITFKSAEEAITWALEKRFYATQEAAKTAYDKVKVDGKPASAKAMWELWVEHCNGVLHD